MARRRGMWRESQRPPLRRLARAVAPVFVVALGLSFLACWYTPAVIYSSNQRLFEFPLVQMLPMLAIPMVSIAILLTVPGIFFPAKARRLYTTVLGSLAVYGWVQGFFLVRDYGLLDGDVDLPVLAVAPLVVAALVVVGVSLLLSRSALNPGVPFVAFVLIFTLQAGHLATTVAADTKPQASLAPAQVDPLYELGRSNVIVVLLDSLQSDVFASVVRDEPELARGLDGFTYYRNTLGVAPTTYGSLPAIHSGVAHERGTSMKDFFDDSISRDSFLTDIAASGIPVAELNPVGDLCPRSVECFRRLQLRETSGRHRLFAQAAELADLSMFRLAPPELKGEVYNETRWRLRTRFAAESPEEDSDGALRSITRRLRVTPQERTAKFIHLFSTHPPATRKADCTLLREPTDITRTNARGIATCALSRIVALVDRLKELGVYEDTSLVLLSDHGYLEMGNARARGEDPDFVKLTGRANPLLAVKRAGASGRLRTRDAELSIADVRTIVCSLAEACGKEGRRRWDRPDPDRIRPFLDYEWSTIFWHASTLRHEQRYEVSGPMFDPDSWSDLEAEEPPEVDRLRFDDSDDATHFGFGWRPEGDDGSRWTFGQTAGLWLDLPPRNVELTFKVGRRRAHTAQTVRFNVNGTTIARVPIERMRETITVVVPRQVAARNDVDEIQIQFAQHDRAVRRGDPNALAVRFFDLTVD